MPHADLDNDLHALVPGNHRQPGRHPSHRPEGRAGRRLRRRGRPIMAQTAIKTPTDGLTVGEVTIEVGGFKVPAYRAMPAGRHATCRWCWWSPRSSACTSTSPTSRAASPVPATWRSRRSCSCARATRQGYGEMAKLMAEVISKVPDAQVMGDLDATVTGPAPMAATWRAWASPVSAGAAASAWLYAAHSPASRRRWPGTAAWSASHTELTPQEPDRHRRPAERRRCWACTAAPMAASRSRRWIR